MYAKSEHPNTPQMVPPNAVIPLRFTPATRKMITNDNSTTAAKHIQIAFAPCKHKGNTIFHTARQLNTKESKALKPVRPPNISSSRASPGLLYW